MRTANKGQALAEYGLVLALIAVACISALQILGGGISQQITDVAGQIASVKTGSGSSSGASLWGGQTSSLSGLSSMPVAPASIGVVPLSSSTPTQVTGTILTVKPPDTPVDPTITFTPATSTLSLFSAQSAAAPSSAVPVTPP